MSAQEPQESQDVDDRGRCKLHPGIQLRHQKRSGEWRVLLRACPLCVSGLPPTAPRPEDDAVPPTAAAAASSAAAVPDPGEGGGGVSRGGESGDEDGPDRLADSEKRRRKARRKDKERSRGERRGKRDGGDGKRTGGGRSKSRGGRDRDKSGRGGDDKPEKDEGGGPPPQQHPLRRKGSRSGGRPRSPSPEQSPRVEREQPSGEADGLPSPPIRHRTREDEAREYNSFVDFIQRDRQKMAAAAGTATAAQGPGQPPRRDVGDRGGEHDDGVDEEEEDDDHRTQVTQDAGTDESDRGDEDGDGSDGGSDADGRTVDEDREGPSEAVDEADDIGASLHSGGTRPSDNLSRRREGARSAGGYGGDPLPPPPPFRRRQPRQLAASCGPSYYGGGSGYDPQNPDEHDDGPRDSDSDGRGGGEGGHRVGREDGVPPAPASGNFGDADGGGGGARVLEQKRGEISERQGEGQGPRRTTKEDKMDGNKMKLTDMWEMCVQEDSRRGSSKTDHRSHQRPPTSISCQLKNEQNDLDLVQQQSQSQSQMQHRQDDMVQLLQQQQLQLEQQLQQEQQITKLCPPLGDDVKMDVSEQEQEQMEEDSLLGSDFFESLGEIQTGDLSQTAEIPYAFSKPFSPILGGDNAGANQGYTPTALRMGNDDRTTYNFAQPPYKITECPDNFIIRGVTSRRHPGADTSGRHPGADTSGRRPRADTITHTFTLCKRCNWDHEHPDTPPPLRLSKNGHHKKCPKRGKKNKQTTTTKSTPRSKRRRTSNTVSYDESRVDKDGYAEEDEN